jgi:hypothetical protein
MLKRTALHVAPPDVSLPAPFSQADGVTKGLCYGFRGPIELRQASGGDLRAKRVVKANHLDPEQLAVYHPDGRKLVHDKPTPKLPR